MGEQHRLYWVSFYQGKIRRSSYQWNDALLVEQKLWLQLITTDIVNWFAKTRIQTGKDDGSKIILAQTNGSQGNVKISGGKEDYLTDGEKKKKKSSQPKDIRRTDLKRYYSIDEYLISQAEGITRVAG
ncbi:UNVERIFIED_CONTAM: hypothetical protein K2H54_072221 [Gekko kuhli]